MARPAIEPAVPATKPGRSGLSCAGAGGISPRSAGSRCSSATIASMRMAPTPSDREWWSLTMSAASPPSMPSTRVTSHNGRARSKAAIADRRASASTASRVPGGGAVTRLRCQFRSKCGSQLHRGPVRRNGDSTTHWRSEGISRDIRSTRSTSTSQSGVRSSQSMTTTVERSAGSRSMYQVNASLARMYAIFIFPTLGPRLVRRQGHWSPAVQPAGPPPRAAGPAGERVDYWSSQWTGGRMRMSRVRYRPATPPADYRAPPRTSPPGPAAGTDQALLV